jgi:hypothetical protein
MGIREFDLQNPEAVLQHTLFLCFHIGSLRRRSSWFVPFDDPKVFHLLWVDVFKHAAKVFFAMSTLAPTQRRLAPKT